MASILSTGKKKAKASRVFGGNLVYEGEASLCYTPSPSAATTRCSSTAAPVCYSNPKPTVLFADDENADSRKRKSVTIVEDKENSSGNAQNPANEAKESSIQSIRNAELNRLRAHKSPLRRNIAQKAQKAINDAASSVHKTLSTPISINKSLNATRKAKKAVLRERSKQTKTVRFQWGQEKQEAKKFYETVEENRRQLLTFQRQLASAHFKEKARKDESQRMQYIAELDKSSKFNSEVFREHQKTLKEQKNDRRKKSMDARAKLRQNKKDGEERMQAQRRQEDAAIYEVRYDLHRARREAAKADGDKHRESMEFRTEEAIRIREARAQQEADEQTLVQQSFALKREAARDVDEYKKQQAAERRESHKGRNMDARRRRKETEKHTTDAMKAEHESYELKWAGERDAAAYEKRMREERRKSLAGRNKESARHAKVMEELRGLSMEQEAESFMLKFEAQNDVKKYLAKVEEDRRKSLQFRGEESKKHRQWMEEQHEMATKKAAEEGTLQSNCQKDVQNYKKEQAEKARKSLQFRLKEAKLRRLESENQRNKQQTLDHESFKLDSLARMDVDEYVKDCKQRRRKSLAFRAKEKRRHAAWKRQQEEKALEARQETAHLQSLDYQYMAMAQQQERARMALDALRSAGCNIKGNPFGDLLNL